MNPTQTEVSLPSTTIFSTIRQEVFDFLNNYIVIVPGYSFHQYLTIKRIHLYLNSKFEQSNEGDALWKNRERLFVNVVVPACEIASKMLNVDSKDVRLLPQDPKSYFSTYLLEKELRQWLKTSKIANILNKIAEDAPRFGSVVLEKTKDGAKVIDLRKLMLDPTVESIKDSRFVTTIAYMTPSELRETGWDDVELAISRFGTTYGQTAYEDRSGGVNLMRSTPYVKVYKRYGEVQQGWIDGSTSQKMVKALFIVAGAEEQQKSADGKNTTDLGVVLFKSRWYKEWPYKDFHYQKVLGRWLGLGIVESLFDVQVRMNELKNQKRISMELSSLHIFQTKDNQIVRNVLDDLQSGDIMLSKSGIEPVANEERNLPAFKDEEESYLAHAQRISFAYDAVSGAAAPASSTATANINAQQQATSTFGFKRENYTNMLRDFFNDLVLPQLMSDLTPEHIMRFTGNNQELNKLDEAAAEIYANDALKDMVLNGETPTVEHQDVLREIAKKKYRSLGENRFLKIKKAFYKDAQFEFDFNIGNEQLNPQLVATNTQAVLSAIGSNPELMQNPVSKLLLFKYAEALGISRSELEMADTESTQKIQEGQQAPPGQPIQQQPVKSPIQPQLTTNQ